MPTIAEIKAQYPDLGGLDDNQVVDALHQAFYQDLPREQVAGSLGVKLAAQAQPAQDRPWYQDAAEVGRQLAGGVMVDVPKMFGNVIRRVSEDGGAADNFGRSMVESANARAPEWELNTQGEGAVSGTLARGARALGPMASVVAASVIPGGQVIAPVLAAGQFGLSSAQETEDKLRLQGVADDKATEAGWKTGMIQGPLEGIATAVGGQAFKPLAKAFIASPTMGKVVSQMTNSDVLKPFMKAMGINAVVQPATEIAQDTGTEYVEQSYGAKPQSYTDIAMDSGRAALGMTALLGPFAYLAHSGNAKRAEALKGALENPDAPIELKQQAVNAVSLEAKRRGVPEADIAAWGDSFMQGQQPPPATPPGPMQRAAAAGMPSNFTATPAATLGAQTTANAGAGFNAGNLPNGMGAPAQIMDQAELDALVESERRDQQVMLAQMDMERQKQAEIDAAFEAKPALDAQQRAAELEAPSAMAQAFQRAQTPAEQPATVEQVPAEPVESAAQVPEPRIVERTPDVPAPMPRELAELQVDMDGGEVVRTQNRNGKWAYHVVKQAPSAAPQPSADIMNKLGKPFTNLFAAKTEAGRRGAGFEPVKVGDGAYVVRQVAEKKQPEAAAEQAPVATDGVATKPEPPVVKFRKEGAAISANLPKVSDGSVRLWRGNRPGEEGKATQFTNDLAGIAIPFRNVYGGALTYVDVPEADASAYLKTGAAAEGAEFNLPDDIARKATIVQPNTTQSITQPTEQPLAQATQTQPQQTQREEAPKTFDQLPDLTPDQREVLDPAIARDLEKQYQQDLVTELKRKRGLLPEQKDDELKRSPFKTFLIRHGVSDKPADVVGEGNAFRANNIIPTLFRKNGIGMDELVNRAAEAGFITQEEADNGEGVPKLVEMIRSEVAGTKRHLPLDMQDESAEQRAEQNLRLEVEADAQELGLVYDPDMDTKRLQGMVMRVRDRVKRAPKNGLLKPDRILKNARDAATRIEQKRAQLEAQSKAFADLNQAEQDAALDIFTDEDGNVQTFMRTVDAQAAAQWFSDNPTWTNENATDTRANQDSGQVGTPATGVAPEGAGRDQATDPGAQQGSAQGAGEEGLTAPTRADVLAQQAALEAEEQRKKDGGDKPIQRKVTADQVDLFNPQGSIFDAPAEPAEPAAPAAEVKPAVSANTVFTEDAAAAARARLKAKLGRLNSGIDPETMMDGITLAGYHIEKGARTFAAYAKAMIEDLGEGVKPYLKSWYMGVKFDPKAASFGGMDSASAVESVDIKTIANTAAKADTDTTKDTPNVSSTNASMERDSPVSSPEPAVGDAIQDDATGIASRAGKAGGRATGGTRGGQQDGSGVPAGGAAAAGERGDQRLPDAGQQPELTDIVTGADFREPGGDSGITGIPPEPIATSQVDATADRRTPGLKNTIERNKASKTPVIPLDLDNIRATLPQLLPGQQDDVLLAEKRFAKPDGYGMLFTNGTGTGKTFSGLGVVKRYAMQGKTNTLIVAPDTKIAADWIESAKLLGLDVTALNDTTTHGKGIVVTTYANLGMNDSLAKRQWDVVVADEAHSLMQAADGEPTTYLHNLRAITYHPDGAGQRHSMLNRDKLIRAAELGDEILALEKMVAADSTTAMQRNAWEAKSEKLQAELGELRKELDKAQQAIRDEVDARQGAGRTRLVALSATPFAYEKTIDWANGYLFDYNEGQASERNEFRGYNSGSNKDRYMMQHFGYSMRYNKLTRPDANVDSGLMQRQWNANLKKSGALSGRMLDVVPDYDRRFILVESAIGNRIDEALEWISEQRQAEKGQGPFATLSDAINEQFKYLQKRYLLEAIKATEVIPIVKQHLALGRKVVVFHDYKKGGGFNPFVVNSSDDAIKAAVGAFNDRFSDLVNYPFGSMPSPIDVFKKELPGVLLINGDEKKADLHKRYKQFQDDAKGPQVMLVQSAKNKGWSGHDTTGKHQRVLINLGQPTAPTLAIQQEGRIYRTGQATDAIMRYMNTGTNWERWTFASTIATRASTAENLGMGEMARALKDSFIQSFEESDTYEPGHEGEGKGGKERDKAANDAITAYDRAKTFYFGQQKKNSRTKAQEGVDYFATPEPVGLKMVQWLDARGGESTLEPSAGHGAIARWLPDNTNRTAIEPSFALRSKLALVMEMKETGDRILGEAFEDHHISNKYDGIVMNPPFGTAGKTAVDHIAKAATHLRDGGRLVAILPTGPAADKKFDKWFYEESERPAKPLQTRTGMQKVYAGDTIIFEGKRFIAKSTGKYPQSLASSDYVTDGVTKAHHGGYSVEPGPRIEMVKLADGLSLVANIKLPQVTFERAGTAAATRIVVIEKNGANVMTRDLDYSDITDIKELFDKLESLDFAARTKPVDAAPAEPVKAEKPTAAPKPAKVTAHAGDEVTIGGTKYEIEIYTTNAGKEKRGVWMASKAEAMKYSARAFTHSSNKGKWFVDEYWFPKDAEIIKPDAASATPQRWASSAPRVMSVDEVKKTVNRILRGVLRLNTVEVMDMPVASVVGASEIPKGETTPDGRIIVYAAAAESEIDVFRTVFHELFHRGVKRLFASNREYILAMLNLSVANPAISKAAAEWKLSDGGVAQRKEFEKAGALIGDRKANYEALAVEEALALIGEKLRADRALGSKKMSFVVRSVAKWMAKIMDAIGMNSLAQNVRAMTYSELEAFVSETIDNSAGAINLGTTARIDGSKNATVFRETKIVGETSRHSWDAPEPSKFDDLVYRLQDKQIDTKRVIESIKLNDTLTDDKNVYLQEELFHGRAAARTEDFVNKELSPLVNMMKIRGLDIAALDEYLHARHAEEANKLIAERNPEIPDGGSGMTTQAARDYLAKLTPAEKTKFEAVAAKVDAILATTRQLYADYDLESQEKVDGWGEMFKHYVPLMREDKDGGMGIGQGFSIKGKEVKGRTGSTRKVVDILANIALQRERAIVRGEKNRVATALVGLVKANPNKDFWHVGPPPAQKVYDPASNSVVERADPLYKSRENVLVAKIKGKDGQVTEQAVTFNEDNERAVRMAAALKNLDAAQLEGLLGVSAKITRYFAAINTQYNPIFGTVNLVRDVQGALFNLTTTPLKGQTKAIAGDTLSALKGIYLDARAARDGKTPTSKWAQLWEEFQDEGGQTGFRDLFANSADRAKAIERELNPTAWMDSPLGKVFTADGTLKVPLTVAQKKATGVFDWLSDYNLAMENAVRLASYKAGIDQGMSKQQAASIAKNLTVNFNRKGQVGQQAGALYAFFNASMQGTARLGETLFTMEPGKPKTIRLSATGKKIVYGGVLLGVAQAVLLAAAGFEDEEPPDFVRERSMIIPTGGKTYVTIPMPLGLHVLPNMGRIPAEFAMGGFKDPAKHIAKMLGLFAGTFNPIGGGASLVQMLSPTAIDPIVALAENKDWTGKPIAKVSFNKATPGHQLAKDTASSPAKWLSEAINFISGGTEYTAGVLSPTPDQIDYLWGQATGGVGREVSKVNQTVSSAFSGEELPPHKMPLVGRFYGNADAQSSQSNQFYANINRLNEHEAEIKGRRKAGDAAGAAQYLRENPDARLFIAGNRAEREVQKLRLLKRELVAKGADKAQVAAVEERIRARVARFNELVKAQALKKAA